MGGVGDLPLLLGEVFGSENIFRAQIVQKEAASLDFSGEM